MLRIARQPHLERKKTIIQANELTQTKARLKHLDIQHTDAGLAWAKDAYLEAKTREGQQSRQAISRNLEAIFTNVKKAPAPEVPLRTSSLVQFKVSPQALGTLINQATKPKASPEQKADLCKLIDKLHVDELEKVFAFLDRAVQVRLDIPAKDVTHQHLKFLIDPSRQIHPLIQAQPYIEAVALRIPELSAEDDI